MQVTLTFSVDPTSTSPLAFQQALDWILRIDGASAAAAEKAPARAKAVQNGVTEHSAAIALEDAAVTVADPVQTQPAAGEAAPPGLEGPLPKPRKGPGGRPPSAATIAKRAAEAAAADATASEAPPPPASAPQIGNGAAVPGPGARPPGFPAPAASAAAHLLPQAPAMPPQSSAAETGFGGRVSESELRELITEANNYDASAVASLMRSAIWPDGSSKPRWFSVERVVPEHFDRLYKELLALAPVA